MPDSPRRSPGQSADFADYAASLTGALAVMARKHGLQTLADLLEMARLEAEAAAGHSAPKAN